jgi:hypothetical protein
MSYIAVAIYDLDANFIGYGIKGANKLQTTNIYGVDETPALNEQLSRLNASQALAAHWPSANDPDVVALLQNEEFYPLTYSQQEVVDEEESKLVWRLENEVDEHGNPTGRQIPGPELDPDLSQVMYQFVNIPDPSSVMLRTKLACEAVARYRSGV